ncbi:ribonuclease P protein subunit p21-like isoform X2 [Xyrauchen texanus]|uniref:ribonuclease P protein subunit p21-like isoform X2 n=1 Tax=Xyrauchen texanus TaxID=154827 RepID=UPI002241BC87|nr:ribonuclease P protein subunit p21-like isoform X2 [Xyrauchen texanus]
MAGNIKDKEAFQRLNFLYQAARCVLAQNSENIELARFYCFTQKTISKRLVLRQDPSVKRTICKKCCTLLVPGVTSTVRQKNAGHSSKYTIQEKKSDFSSGPAPTSQKIRKIRLVKTEAIGCGSSLMPIYLFQRRDIQHITM